MTVSRRTLLGSLVAAIVAPACAPTPEKPVRYVGTYISMDYLDLMESTPKGLLVTRVHDSVVVNGQLEYYMHAHRELAGNRLTTFQIVYPRISR